MKAGIEDTYNFEISHNKLRWILSKGIDIIDALEKNEDKSSFWKEYHAYSNKLMEKCKVDKKALNFSIILLKIIGCAFAYEERGTNE